MVTQIEHLAKIQKLHDRIAELESKIPQPGQTVLPRIQTDHRQDQALPTTVSSAQPYESMMRDLDPTIGQVGQLVGPPGGSTALADWHVAGVYMDPRMCADIVVDEILDYDRTDTGYMQKLLRILLMIRSRQKTGGW